MDQHTDPCSMPPDAQATPKPLIRDLRDEDRDRVAALFGRLSPESLYQRFHCAGMCVDGAALDQLTAGRVLVAELGQQFVGMASYHCGNNGEGTEMDFVVDDAAHRQGIGTALCTELIHIARRAGIRQLNALLLQSNHAGIRMLQGLSLPLRHQSADGVLTITLELSG